jgi:hypothetical protein
MTEHNPFAQQLKTVQQMVQNHRGSVRIEFVADHPNQKRYNLPTAQEVAGIFPGHGVASNPRVLTIYSSKPNDTPYLKQVSPGSRSAFLSSTAVASLAGP